MLSPCLSHFHDLARHCLHAVSTRLSHWTKPLTVSLAAGVAADLLRQQLLMMSRTTKRPALTQPITSSEQAHAGC